MLITHAAVAHPGAGAFAWEEVECEDPRPYEVLVRMVAAGLCHLDLAVRDEHLFTPLPAVLGHEGAGVVETVGDNVTRVKPGDRVLLSFSSCGRCPACRAGRPAYCLTFSALNYNAARPDSSTPYRTREGRRLGGRFFGQSSFAQHSLVDERSVVRVDARSEDELATLAAIGCGMQHGAGALFHELRPGPGATIAVYGTGSVGLSAILAAQLTPASRIVGIDQVPSRLELAREFGASHTIDVRSEDPARKLAEITQGLGVTHALECTGQPEVLAQAVWSLATEGTVAVLGSPPKGNEAAFDVNFLLSGRSVQGVTMGSSDLTTFLPALVGLYRAGRLPFDRMLRFYPADQINEAADALSSGEVIMPVLRFPSVAAAWPGALRPPERSEPSESR